ncbi:MAG: tetratricopeptide repeat protein [Acidobacteria bacterium]|nr:tetratricopeptide repeat protein [Acidobacteriota bacterium]
MRSWVVVACLCVTVGCASAQGDEAAKANALYLAGKKLEALPLYEEITKAQPKEYLYYERLADCLGAKSLQLDDGPEAVNVRTRMRDAAKRAVELGDPKEFMKLMANSDPAVALDAVAGPSPGRDLVKEGEKAYGAGDYETAIAKYAAALEADPHLYQAALYAGDSAFAQKDLATSAKWFAKAIAIDPNRETAYRYWGDAILRYGRKPMAAKEKFIQAVVAEPYSRLAWQGIQQWAQTEKATIVPPRIDRPLPPQVDSKKPNTTNITIDIGALDDKKNPGGSAWMMYSLIRASYRGDTFKKNFPNEGEYRHTLKEEDAALSVVASSVKEKKIKPSKLDEGLRNLIAVNDAGMLDCWILVNGADKDIAQDYPAYMKEHRQLLFDYLDRFVVHGGVSPAEQ